MLNIEQIQKIVPHRFPFLMLDRILELSKDKVIAIKNLTINEPFFQGHFPDNKIMPGVLLIECVAQAAIILFDYSHNEDKYENNESPCQDAKNYYMGSVKAKFIKPATVGDVLQIEVKPLKILSNSGIIKGEISVNSTKIVQVELGISIKKDT